MDIKELISDNLAPVIGLIVILMFLVDNKRIPVVKKRFFIIAVIAFGAELFFKNADEIAYRLGHPSIMRALWSALGYSVRPFIIYVLLGIELDLSHDRQRKAYALMIIPLLLNFLMATSVFYTGLFYGFNEYNDFIRGPLGYGLFFAAPIYLVIFLVRIAADIKLKNRAKAGMGIGCSILVIIGMILEFAEFRAFSSETVMMMALMLYFMFLQSSSFSSHTKNLEHKATHDGLTGLINRTGYELVIKEFEEEINIGFLMIDVDFFKTVNDTYGHDVGDKVLKAIAKLLKKTFRTSDYVIRIGGDEFAVILPNATDNCAFSIKNKIEKINVSLEGMGDEIPKVSISAGLAFSSLGYTEDLYKRADQALYHSKQTTKRCCSIDGELRA